MLVGSEIVAANGTTAGGAPPHAKTVGFRDFSYPITVGTGLLNGATAQKPESKLWYVDGIWWATLYEAAAGAYHIHRLDPVAQTWTDTGVLIDERPESRQDVLWDGTELYMASRCGGSTPENRLLRYTYDPVRKTYVLDPGFPVAISGGGTEALTIAKDTTGTLWIAYTLNDHIFVNRTLGSDKQWGVPLVVPVAHGTTITPDDIGAVTALRGKIGVFWTNQLTQADYFAVHTDGASATAQGAWTEEVAISGNLAADNHINMKLASDGRLFVATKTSRINPQDTLVGLLVRSPAGVWAPLRNVATVSTKATRPLCVLDESHHRVYVFYSVNHVRINYKISSMDRIAFPTGGGVSFIASATAPNISDPTSCKQNVTPGSGIEVLASDSADLSYWHNGLP